MPPLASRAWRSVTEDALDSVWPQAYREGILCDNWHRGHLVPGPKPNPKDFPLVRAQALPARILPRFTRDAANPRMLHVELGRACSAGSRSPRRPRSTS